MQIWVTTTLRVTQHATPLAAMAKQLAVTYTEVANLKSDVRKIFWFGRRFGVRVSAGGRKDFVFSYWAPGRTTKRLLTLGQFGRRERDGELPAGTISLEEALEKHNAARRLLAKGIDPFVQEKEQAMQAHVDAQAATAAKAKAEANRGPTLREAFELWVSIDLAYRVDDNGSGRLMRRGRKDNGKEARGYFEHHKVLERLGDRPLAELRRLDFMQVVDASLAKGGRRATDVLLAYLKQFLAFAEVRGYVEYSVLGSIKRSRVVGKSQAKNRVLDDREIVRLVDRLPMVGLDPVTVLALRFVLASGQRPGEVVSMRKADLNADRTLWSIPAARYKTGVAHLVPLSEHARALLAQVDRYNTGSAFVFTSPQAALVAPSDPAKAAKRKRQPKDAHITERALSQGVRDKLGTATPQDVQPAAKELGIARFTPHDLRRTCRTNLSALGVSKEVAERVIGHLPEGMVGVYDMHDFLQQRREALDMWGAKLAKLEDEVESASA